MCPYWKKPCEKVKKCRHRRKGIRYYEIPGKKPEAVPFESCVFDVIADSLENLVSRMIGQQAAMEGTRNEVNKVNKFFKDLKDLQSIKALEK